MSIWTGLELNHGSALRIRLVQNLSLAFSGPETLSSSDTEKSFFLFFLSLLFLLCLVASESISIQQYDGVPALDT